MTIAAIISLGLARGAPLGLLGLRYRLQGLAIAPRFLTSEVWLPFCTPLREMRLRLWELLLAASLLLFFRSTSLGMRCWVL